MANHGQWPGTHVVVGAPAVVLVVLVLVVVPVVAAALPPRVDLVIDQQGESDPDRFTDREPRTDRGKK
jgi:hypothetical protein